jgi:hypothetical protein
MLSGPPDTATPKVFPESPNGAISAANADAESASAGIGSGPDRGFGACVLFMSLSSVSERLLTSLPTDKTRHANFVSDMKLHRNTSVTIGQTQAFLGMSNRMPSIVMIILSIQASRKYRNGHARYETCIGPFTCS